jgi:hypothetical protein
MFSEVWGNSITSSDEAFEGQFIASSVRRRHSVIFYVGFVEACANAGPQACSISAGRTAVDIRAWVMLLIDVRSLPEYRLLSFNSWL